MAEGHEEVKKWINARYNMRVEHDGSGEIHLEFKSLLICGWSYLTG